MQLQGNPLRSRTSPRIAKWCRLLGVIQRALGCLVDRPSAAAILTEKSSRCSNGVVEMIVWLVSEFSPPPPQWPCLLLTQYACKVPSHRCTLGIDGSQSQLRDSVHPGLSTFATEWGSYRSIATARPPSLLLVQPSFNSLLKS